MTGTRQICREGVTPCEPVDSPDPIPLGYIGGYFDEVKLTKGSPGL